MTDGRNARLKPDYASQLKIFVCIMPINILLDSGSHMAKPEVNVAVSLLTLLGAQ